MRRLGQVLQNNIFPFTAALLALVAAQFWLGAFDAEMVGDSASHYVSGMFIADLLRGGIFHPIERLRDFAAHYPLVGIGHWPPFYYGVEAVWSLVAPFDQRMLLLAAATAALVPATIYALLRPRLGVVPAIFGASAIVLCPMVLNEVTTLMLDIPVALGCLAATVSFAQFLRTGRPLPGVLFAIIAATTLMVKGNAGCLVFMPLVAIVVTEKFERLRSPWLWVSIPIVLLLAGPWYLFTHKMVEAGYRGTFGINYALLSLGTDLRAMFFAAGAGVLLAAIGGVWVVFRQRQYLDPLWGTFFALIVSVLVFQAIVPVALEGRYILPALPPLFALAAFGVSRLPDYSTPKIVFIIMLVLILPGMWTVLARPHMGIREATETALREMPSNNRALLVISDPDGEGAAISELVRLRIPSSDVFGVRGVRLLGGGGYNNQDYIPLYRTLDEVAAAIRTYRIPLLLLRNPNRRGQWAHIKQVADLVARDPGRYQLVWAGKGGMLYKVTESYSMPGDRKLLTELSAPHALGGGNAASR
ncbi:MAG: glycosyltransferase family 39 protein [Burkholderiales bacterium]